MKLVPIAILFIVLASCSKEDQTSASESPAAPEPAQTQVEETPSSSAILTEILDSQSDEVKARFQYRRPQETIELFEIEPGMKVAEALPGGGWYSKILIPYLGETGELAGLSYPMGLVEAVFPPAWHERFKTFSATWPQTMAETGVTGAAVSAYAFGDLPEDALGTMDRVIFIRALHHLGRADGYMSSTIEETYKLLKPGGTVGVVQHQAPEEMSDEWAKGDKGYLKKSNVIAAFEAAGFKLKVDSDINNNAKDIPAEGDVVWRLPPSLRVADDDEELKTQMLEIGESNRMTLVFEKPAA